ncbi:YIP1 family protein [Candidatus Gracilibacteria bacterium]|nr:YIP1 family protein [Candidatus Gracilibacteria bacterium]
MFQEMLNGSIAVLTRPSVSTFEEHEKNNLGWALIYVSIAAVIVGLISAALAPFQAATIQSQINSQLATLPPEQREVAEEVLRNFEQFGLLSLSGQPNVIGALFSSLLTTLIGFLIGLGIYWLLGRAFGGTGSFGELAYDFALFNVPLTLIGVVLNFIPLLGALLGLALWVYSIILTYMALQAGMNLPGNKAILVLLIPLLIPLLLFGCLCVLLLFGVGAAAN